MNHKIYPPPLKLTMSTVVLSMWIKCHIHRCGTLCQIIIKSPKQNLGDLLFLLRFLLLFSFLSLLFLFSFSFLSADHELVHGRSQELLDRISKWLPKHGIKYGR